MLIEEEEYEKYGQQEEEIFHEKSDSLQTIVNLAEQYQC